MPELDHQDDLDLLLSLEDRVLETPPGSPSGYLSDDGRPKHVGDVDMSVFKDAVKDCLDYDYKNVKKKSQKPKQVKGSDDIEVEKFSGLRIQNPIVTRVELSNYLSDIKFVRIPAIKNSLKGDTLSGCWATIGVLVEKGAEKTSSIGKPFAIWKMGCLDDNSVSLFLFGDAFDKNCNEKIGTVFALFNCTVRKNNSDSGCTLSVFAARHIIKLGHSADIGVCQAKGSNGTPCCISAINKRHRKYCNYHKQNGLKQYQSQRAELKGGNVKTAFKDYRMSEYHSSNYHKSEGIYMVKPLNDNTNFTKSNKPVKLLSVDKLKKALSTADKVTTNHHSQGIRFLSHVTGTVAPKTTNEVESLKRQQMNKMDIRSKPSEEHDSKRMKMDPKQTKGKGSIPVGVKLIELDFASSDEDL